MSPAYLLFPGIVWYIVFTSTSSIVSRQDYDVDIDDIGTYPHLKDEDHDLSMPVRAR